MNALPTAATAILPISPAQLDRVRAFEQANLARPQVPITTHHLLHAGLYARTITIPDGVVLTGALIKIATVLVLSGDAILNRGDQGQRFTGYHVIPASAHRKQAILAMADTHLTMLFQTDAKRVEDAEAQFTDEADLLFSRRGENVIIITGESP